MTKASGVLTFCDAMGKSHLRILQEFFENQDKIKRAAYLEGFKRGKEAAEQREKLHDL